MTRNLVPPSIPQKCRCPLSEEGCNWTGKLEDVTEHMSVCQRSLIDVECPYKVIGCEVNWLTKREIDEHLKECQILHQQLLLKKVIGSNEQRRSVKKKFELENSWILLAVIVIISVIVLGVSVFVQYQTQSNNKIELLKSEQTQNNNNIKILKSELKSLKNNIENKMQGMDNTLKGLKNKIEIESQSTDNALLNLQEKIEDYLFKLPNLIDDKILALKKKIETALTRMYDKAESRYSRGIINDIFGTPKKISNQEI